MNIFLLFVTLPCLARVYPIAKPVQPELLHRELVAAGFKVDGVTCVNRACKLSLPDSEKKTPAAVIAAHDESAHAKRRERAKALAAKLDSGSITPEERDELLKLLLSRYLGAD